MQSEYRIPILQKSSKMDNVIINHWAVWICAALNLALGAFWYSPLLFFKAWKKENKLTDQDLSRLNPGLVYSLTFLLSLLIAYNLAFFLGDENVDGTWGLTAGFLSGFGWAAAIFVVVALFELRSWRYILINAGYIIFYFSLTGWIIGFWR